MRGTRRWARRGSSMLVAIALATTACETPPYVLAPRAPPPRAMPAVALPPTPPAPGSARVVLDTLDGPMLVSVESDPTFVPPGSSRPAPRAGELCTTPCVADLPPGRYRLFLAPTADNAHGDVDDVIFGAGLNVYRRAPGKYDTPTIGSRIAPTAVMIGGFVLGIVGFVFLAAAHGPDAGRDQAIGGTGIGLGIAALIGGAVWFYEASRATQQEGATTSWLATP